MRWHCHSFVGSALCVSAPELCKECCDGSKNFPGFCSASQRYLYACLESKVGRTTRTAHGSRICFSARLRLGEDLCAGQDEDDACVCGRFMAAGGTHSFICGALWHTVVACHNALTEAWLRIAARGGIAATREPHVKQLPQRPRAMGLPALPTRRKLFSEGWSACMHIVAEGVRICWNCLSVYTATGMSHHAYVTIARPSHLGMQCHIVSNCATFIP